MCLNLGISMVKSVLICTVLPISSTSPNLPFHVPLTSPQLPPHVVIPRPLLSPADVSGSGTGAARANLPRSEAQNAAREGAMKAVLAPFERLMDPNAQVRVSKNVHPGYSVYCAEYRVLTRACHGGVFLCLWLCLKPASVPAEPAKPHGSQSHLGSLSLALSLPVPEPASTGESGQGAAWWVQGRGKAVTSHVHMCKRCCWQSWSLFFVAYMLLHYDKTGLSDGVGACLHAPSLTCC